MEVIMNIPAHFWISFFDFLVSISLGVLTFGIVLSMKHIKGLQTGWYKILRFILGVFSVTALSNAWCVLLVADAEINPLQLILNISVLVLFVYCVSYYKFHYRKQVSHRSLGNFLKFLKQELSD
jgi:hypothetical protein